MIGGFKTHKRVYAMEMSLPRGDCVW